MVLRNDPEALFLLIGFSIAGHLLLRFLGVRIVFKRGFWVVFMIPLAIGVFLVIDNDYVITGSIELFTYGAAVIMTLLSWWMGFFRAVTPFDGEKSDNE